MAVPATAANACYWKDVWKKLYAMRKTWKLCDTTLLSDEGIVFMAHSIILASGSSVFHAQLVDKTKTFMQEVDATTIRLQGVPGDMLQVTLDFIYGVTPDTIKDFKKLQKGAELLGIHGARTFCMQQLIELEQLAKNNGNVTEDAQSFVDNDERAKCPVSVKSPVVPPGKKEANIGKCPYFSNRGAEINYFVPLKKRFLMKVLTELKKDHIKAAPGQFPEEEKALRELNASDDDQSLSQDSTTLRSSSGEGSASAKTQSAVQARSSNSCRFAPQTPPKMVPAESKNTASNPNPKIYPGGNAAADNRQSECQFSKQQQGSRVDALMDIDTEILSSAKELIPHHIPDLTLGDLGVQCPHLQTLAGQVDMEMDFGSTSPLNLTNDLEIGVGRGLTGSNCGGNDPKRTKGTVDRKSVYPVGKKTQGHNGKLRDLKTFTDLNGKNTEESFSDVTDQFSPDNTEYALNSAFENSTLTSGNSSFSDPSYRDNSSQDNSYLGRYIVVNEPCTGQATTRASNQYETFNTINNTLGIFSSTNVPFNKTDRPPINVGFNMLHNTTRSYELPPINSAAFHSITTLKPNVDFIDGHSLRKDLSPSYSASVSSAALSPNNRTPSLSPNSISSCNSISAIDRCQDHTQPTGQTTSLHRSHFNHHVSMNENTDFPRPMINKHQDRLKFEDLSVNGANLQHHQQYSQIDQIAVYNTQAITQNQQRFNPNTVEVASTVRNNSATTRQHCISVPAATEMDRIEPNGHVNDCLEKNRTFEKVPNTVEFSATGALNKELKREPGINTCYDSNAVKHCPVPGERGSSNESKISSVIDDSITDSTGLSEHTEIDDYNQTDSENEVENGENTLGCLSNDVLLQMLQEGAENKIYSCLDSDCTYTNKMIEYVRSHMYSKHGYGQPDVPCTQCDKAYFSDSQLRTHVKQCHEKQASSKTGNKLHVCDDCYEIFKTPQSLQTHQLKTHGKGRLFSCGDCDFKSPRKKDMQGHMISQHDKAPPGVRVFVCSHCTYKCIDKNRFTEHEASHSSEKNYQCSKCEKSYSTKRGLRNHVKYHSTERPHACTQCSATFKVRAKLRDHVKLMHLNRGQKPYKCGHCSFRASVRGNVNQHIRNTHKGLPVVVVDTQEKLRKHVKDYDYAKLSGEGIEEVLDAGASGYQKSK